MKVHYERAALIARERQAANAFYPGLNYLAAELALNTGRRGWKGVDAVDRRGDQQEPEGKNLADPDFWSVVGQTELQMAKALAGGSSLASARDALERGFQDLHKARRRALDVGVGLRQRALRAAEITRCVRR